MFDSVKNKFVGCEYHGYSSDITRTWPISGTFTPAQRALYEIVLNVQLELINLCNNFPTLDELFDSMSALLGKKLKEIGVISANTTNQMLLKVRHTFLSNKLDLPIVF